MAKINSSDVLAEIVKTTSKFLQQADQTANEFDQLKNRVLQISPVILDALKDWRFNNQLALNNDAWSSLILQVDTAILEVLTGKFDYKFADEA